MKKRNTLLTATLATLLYTNVASAAVLFSDDFDSHSDWSPAQGVSGATCIAGQNCATPIPDGYYDYRVAGTEACSNTDGKHNTLNINGQHPRGTGKSFMMWNEPCYSRSGSWGSDGLLGIDFAPQDEVYVRYWIQFQQDWRWDGDGSADGRALGAAATSPMQKFMHISHLNPANTNLWDFFSGTQNKPRFTPQLAKFGGGSYRVQFNLPHSPLTATRDSSASFNSNVYLGAAPLDMNIPGPGSLPAAPRDGKWHSFEFYVKLNSAGGVADGVSKVWYDGALISSTTNAVWVPAGDDPAQWKWNHAWLGGNNANLYLPANEQWYAIDDVVVSTTYSGPPAQPVSLTATANATNTVSLRWGAGSNGVAHTVNGYRISYGKDAANLNMKVDVGNVTQYDIASLDPSTKYYFAVSAYNKGSYDSNDNEGTRSVTASATTVSGTGTDTAPADAAAPVASISSPATGSTVSGTVSVNVAASDNVAVSKVEMYLNGSIFGVVGAAPYTLTWNTTNNPNATYTLTAKAYDAAGNVGQASSSVIVNNAVAVVDASAPVISSFTMPASATSLTVPVTAFSASDDIGVIGYMITESATAPAVGATTWKSTAPTSCTFSAAGSRIAYAWCKDASGKVSTAKTALVNITTATTTSDAIAPVVSIASPVAGSTVSGIATISANATDNVGVKKVEYYVNGVLRITSTTAPWTITWGTTNYPNGPNTVTVKGYDAAGNVGQSSVTVNVMNDSIAPVVSIASPVAGSTVKGIVTISASATDNVAISKVEYYVNGVLRITSTTAPYVITWGTTNYPNGSNSVTVKAYDAAGNVGQSSVTVNVVNDATAPSVTIASPVAGSTIGGTVPVSATASDNVAVEKVELYLNGALQATSTTAPYGFSWNTANAANGSYTVSAKAYDAAGNIGQTSATVTVFNDTIAPSVSIASPVAGSTIGGAVSVSANASDNVAVKKVELYLNGALVATSSAAPYGFSWNTVNAANGSYTVSAMAYDAAGNIGQTSATVTVFNDTIAPSVSIASPVAGSTIGGAVSVSANASDNVAVKKVELYLNGALVATSSAAPYGFSWNTANAANGSYTVSAKAYDAAGNIGQASATVTVFNDATAPSVSIASPMAGSTVNSAVSLYANASDNVGVTKVEFYVDGALQATSTAAPYGFSWNTATVANGTHTVSAKAHDAAGNVGQSANLSVNVLNDTVAPVISVSAPTKNYLTSSKLAIAASATDNVAVVKMEAYVDNALVLSTSNSSFSVSAAVAKGIHTVTIKAYDASDNVAVFTKTVNRFF